MGIMKILVTGGTGFIGSNLVKKLIEHGHNVTALGVKTEEEIPESVNFLHIGFNEIKDLRQDCIFHLAANNNTLDNNKKEMFRNNVYDPICLFNSLYENGCKKFVYASSTAVYGNSKAPYTEESAVGPLNVYAESKFAFEQFANNFAKNKEVSVIGLRYCNVYGMGEHHKKKRSSMVYQIYNKIIKSEPITLFKFGEQKRDWCYIDDVVEANVKCLKLNQNEIFNIASGSSTSFIEIVEIISSKLQKKYEIEYIDCKFYDKFQNNTECDIQKAKKYLNWNPRFDIKSGIEDYVEKLTSSRSSF